MPYDPKHENFRMPIISNLKPYTPKAAKIELLETFKPKLPKPFQERRKYLLTNHLWYFMGLM